MDERLLLHVDQKQKKLSIRETMKDPILRYIEAPWLRGTPEEIIKAFEKRTETNIRKHEGEEDVRMAKRSLQAS